MSAGGSLGSASGEILISVDQAMRNVSSLQGSLNSFGGHAQSAFGKARDAGLLLTGVGAAIVGGFGLAAKSAADFEQTMSGVKAVTTGTDAQFQQLRQTALQLGKDTVFSATESANAIEELAKAGVSVEDILNGAAEGAVNLASAAGVAVPEAAIIMANALNIFNLAGDQATHVADVFAAAANKSSTDVGQLGLALSQSGSVMQLFGISLEEGVGALALFADHSIKGSDAGTSFKTMLTSMLAPTTIQTAKMEELGLAFFDAQGQFIGLDGVAGQLKDKLSLLTQEDRATALSVLFGNDAVRVANALYEEGATGVKEYTAAVNDSGAAQRAAATRLDNLKGSFEQLKGSVQTLAIIIGTAFLPPLRSLVDTATHLVNKLIGLPAPLQKVAAVLGVAAGAASLLAGGFILLAPRIIAVIQALKALQEIDIASKFADLPVGPVMAVVAALVLLGIAYKENIFGFRDAVNSVAADIAGTFKTILGAINPVIDAIKFVGGHAFDGGKTPVREAPVKHELGSGGLGADAANQAARDAEGLAKFNQQLRDIGLSGKQANTVTETFRDMRKPIRELRNDFKDVTRGAELFGKKLFGDASSRDFKEFRKRMDHLFGPEMGGKVTAATAKLRTAIKGFGDAVAESFGGTIPTLGQVMTTVSNAAKDLVGWIDGSLLPTLGPIFLGVINGAAAALNFLADHMDTIATVVKTLASLIGNTLAEPFRVLAALLRGDFAGAIQVAIDLINQFIAAGAQLLNWVLGVGAPQVALWVGDLWAWLRDEGAPAFFRLVGEILGWVLTVGAPDVIGWTSDLWGWIKGQLFGTGGSGGSTGGGRAPGDFGNATGGSGPTAGLFDIVAGWVLNVGAPTVVGWTTDLFGWIKGQLFGTGPQGGSVGGGRAPGDFGNATGASGGTGGLFDIPAGWILNVGVPTITGWLKDSASTVWASLKAAAGWSFTEVADLGAWTLNTVIPTITGWIKDSVATVWPSLKAAAGWSFTEIVELGSWTLNTIIPTVTGWIKDSASTVWPSLKAAAGWALTEAVDLGSWTLNTMIPTVTGWLKNSASAVWPSLKAAAGWSLTEAVELGSWTLNTIEPTITGWVASAANVTGSLALKLGNPTVHLGTWNLQAPPPKVSFESGFDIGATIRAKILAAGEVLVQAPWKLAVGGPAAVVLSVLFGPIAIGLLIADKIGIVNVLNFTKWVLEVGVAGTIGFIAGLAFGPKFFELLQGSAITVANFVDWKLEVGVPNQVSVIGGIAESLATTIWDQIKKVGPLTIGGKAGSGGDKGDSLALTATVTVDVGTAQQTINTLKESLKTIDDTVYSALLGADDSKANKVLDALVSDLESGWESDTFTSKLDLDNGPAAIAYTDAMTWGATWGASTFTSIFGIDTGPAAIAYTTAFGWGETWAAQTFTASFSIDTSGLDAASAHADAVAAHIAAVMPHSPAKEGPLKKPISFQYIADNLIKTMGQLAPAATRGLNALANQFGSAGIFDAPNAAFAAQLRNVPARSGGTTIINNTHLTALHSREFNDLLEKAEKGSDSHEWIIESNRKRL